MASGWMVLSEAISKLDRNPRFYTFAKKTYSHVSRVFWRAA
jgi:hypothetical protein